MAIGNSFLKRHIHTNLAITEELTAKFQKGIFKKGDIMAYIL